MTLKEKANRIMKSIPIIIISTRIKENPWYAKLMAYMTIGYALSPIDLIPDFIPFLGYLDDIILLPIMITLTLKLMPKAIYDICLEHASKTSPLNKKWCYAIPIVLIWLGVISLLVLKVLDSQ